MISPTPLQTAIGTLLLNSPPVSPLKSDERPVLQEHWTAVLDGLPNGAFDPREPIEKDGEPWLFCFMEKTRYAPKAAYNFLAKRYGPQVFDVQNRAGKTVLEHLYEEAQTRSQAVKDSCGDIPLALLAQVMRLGTIEALQLPEDGQDTAGSGWLFRVLSLKGKHFPYGDRATFPDEILIGLGANPNHVENGIPVGALLIKDSEVGSHGRAFGKRTLQLLLKAGMDVEQSAGNVLNPQQTVKSLLSERDHNFARILNPSPVVDTVQINKEPVPPPPSVFSMGLGSDSQGGSFASLTAIARWESAENCVGVPAIWLAARNTPSVLTLLRKPKTKSLYGVMALAEQAWGQRDSKGRSGWFHWLTQMGGTHDALHSEENAAWVQSCIPAGDVMLANGDGLYAQAVSLVTEMAGARSPSPDGYETRVDEPWLVSYDSLTPSWERMKDGFHDLKHADWWGTPESQQRLAKIVLLQLAQKLHTHPEKGDFKFLDAFKVQGDIKQLHPELAGTLALIHYVNRIENVHPRSGLSKPIDGVADTPFAQFPGNLIIGDDQIGGIIKSILINRLKNKISSISTSDDYQIKDDGNRRRDREKREITKKHLINTEPLIRSFMTSCMSVPNQEDAPVRRARPRA